MINFNFIQMKRTLLFSMLFAVSAVSTSAFAGERATTFYPLQTLMAANKTPTPIPDGVKIENNVVVSWPAALIPEVSWVLAIKHLPKLRCATSFFPLRCAPLAKRLSLLLRFRRLSYQRA